MSAHTPEPWAIVEKPDPVVISNWKLQIGRHSISFFPYVYQFADEAKTCGGFVSDPEMHANARLIAAAPELLEALRAARCCVKDGTATAEIIDAALSKAKEQP